jgi:ElaB/YqjD/DUF883 family membrane-anchored ribosome-binding protein
VTRTVEEIRSELRQERRRLVEAADALRGEVRQTFDLEAQVRARPWVAAGVGAAALLVVGRILVGIVRLLTAIGRFLRRASHPRRRAA